MNVSKKTLFFIKLIINGTPAKTYTGFLKIYDFKIINIVEIKKV